MHKEVISFDAREHEGIIFCTVRNHDTASAVTLAYNAAVSPTGCQMMYSWGVPSEAKAISFKALKPVIRAVLRGAAYTYLADAANVFVETFLDVSQTCES